MNKAILMLTATILALFLALPAAFSADDGPPRLRDEGFSDYERPPSLFDHDMHTELDECQECNVCHHVFNDDGTLNKDETSEGEPCSSCHGLEQNGRQPGLMNAYHLNCKGCHDQIKKGPITCGECHVR